jgi:hypothetical protein
LDRVTFRLPDRVAVAGRLLPLNRCQPFDDFDRVPLGRAVAGPLLRRLVPERLGLVRAPVRGPAFDRPRPVKLVA